MKKLCTVSILLSFATLTGCQTQLTKPECDPFVGNWSGTVSGKYNGDMKIDVAENCRYNINGPFDTPGRLYKDGEKILYQNDLGSNGIVTNDGKTFTMQNTFTGNNYKVEVKKQP